MNAELRTIARELYEVWAQSANWESYMGHKLPTWIDLHESLRQQWIDLAEYVYFKLDY